MREGEVDIRDVRVEGEEDGQPFEASGIAEGGGEVDEGGVAGGEVEE